MAPVASLAPEEADWRDAYDRLRERFPDISADRVAKVLRENAGHAGKAANTLRDMCREDVRDVDPDDAEQVATLLSNPLLFQSSCKEHFRKFDRDRNGALDWPEVLALTNTLYESFGLD